MFAFGGRVQMRRWLAPFTLLTGLVSSLAGSAPAAAQVVNVEGLRKSLTQPGVHGKLGGSITTYNGNTTGTELGGAALIGYRAGRHLMYGSTSANYSNMGGDVRVANAFIHLRYNYVFSDLVAGELFVQSESDRFRRLRLRSLLGIGPRFTILQGETVSLFYGLSYMFEHTTLGESIADHPVRPDDVHRLNNYAALLVVLDPERAQLANTIYFQPRVDDLRDMRLLDVLSLEVSITGRISASLQGTLRYESPVPQPLKRADLMVKNMLGLTF
jgi:putative salt-induced outer membrane protein YdiY